MNEQTRANLVEFIDRLARAGSDDPSIAVTLGIPASTVARLRRENDIEAGTKQVRR